MILLKYLIFSVSLVMFSSAADTDTASSKDIFLIKDSKGYQIHMKKSHKSSGQIFFADHTSKIKPKPKKLPRKPIVVRTGGGLSYIGTAEQCRGECFYSCTNDCFDHEDSCTKASLNLCIDSCEYYFCTKEGRSVLAK